MKKPYYDITPVVSERLGVFPGDRGFRRVVAMAFSQGHHLELSSIEGTLHLGAHTDAPNHYAARGMGIEQRDLSLYLGLCLVVHAKVARGERVGFEHLKPKWRDPKAKRVLVRTQTFPDPDNWNSDFASLSPELIESWAKAGVRLVGIDTPSIDPETAKQLLSHEAVAKNDMAILEGVVLTDVPEGYYNLVALPLKLEGCDASPVRAVLLDVALDLASI